MEIKERTKGKYTRLEEDLVSYISSKRVTRISQGITEDTCDKILKFLSVIKQ